jgi:quinol monooxygenase YgiN
MPKSAVPAKIAACKAYGAEVHLVDGLMGEAGVLKDALIAEHGCIEYGSAIDCPTAIPVQSLLGNDSVMVVEKWSDTAALEAHLTAPHMTDYRTKVRDFVKNVSLRILRPSTDAA